MPRGQRLSKPMPKPRVKRPRKAKKQQEIIASCDQCGGRLPRTAARTMGSHVCYAGKGLPTIVFNKVPHYFCSFLCAADFRERAEETGELK